MSVFTHLIFVNNFLPRYFICCRIYLQTILHIAMRKSQAEIQRAYRKRKGFAFKEKEKLRGQQRRQNANTETKAKQAVQSAIRMRKMRERIKCRMLQNKDMLTEHSSSTSQAYKSKATESRAVMKVRLSLPSSPRKRLAVAQKVAIEEGLILQAHPNKRQCISQEIIEKVDEFYNRDDISQWSPGMKDVINTTDKMGKKIKMQKRYLVCTLKELYSNFIEENNKVISFAKFCDLRPPNIITYSKTPIEACCCLMHKNMINLTNCISEKFKILDSYNAHWIDKWCLCQPLTDSCKILQCDVCTGSYSKIFISRVHLPETFDNINLQYQWWTKDESGHVQRLIACKTLEEAFYELMYDMLDKFCVHHITKRHQADVYKREKEEINKQVNKVILHFDFSENYTCSYQEGAQSSYWNQKQVSIFTVACYKHQETKMIAFVSDNTDHSKTTITCYLDLLFKANVHPEHEVSLWSDGPSGQFKNRFMAEYLQHLKRKYKVKLVTWNFFATAHGKSSIDGVGGALKRKVWNKVKSSQCEVQNALQFVKACEDSTVLVTLVTEDEISKYYTNIASELEKAPKINNIQLSHYWLSKDSGFVVSKLSGIICKTFDTIVQNSTASSQFNELYQTGTWVLLKHHYKEYPAVITELTSHDQFRARCLEYLGSGCYRWPKQNEAILHYKKDIIRIIPAPKCSGSRTREHFAFPDL